MISPNLTTPRLRKSNVKFLDRLRYQGRVWTRILTLLIRTKSMKTPRWFSQSKSYLRITIAGSLVIAAAALGFTAVKMSGPTSSPDSNRRAQAVSKFQKDFDELSDNKVARPGAETDRGPLSAALEEFAHRAIPLDDVPTEASQNAISGFNRFVATTKGVGNGKKAPGAWHLAGPSNAQFPDILTFAGQQYTTSGRITALAISPNCSSSKCRVWVGAAGGGVWRTDNALSGSGANWTFLSGSFGTNAIGSLLLDPNNSTPTPSTPEPVNQTLPATPKPASVFINRPMAATPGRLCPTAANSSSDQLVRWPSITRAISSCRSRAASVASAPSPAALRLAGRQAIRWPFVASTDAMGLPARKSLWRPWQAVGLAAQPQSGLTRRIRG